MNTMLLPVRATSLLAYADALEHISQSQLKVLQAIDVLEPCTNLQISNYLNIKLIKKSMNYLPLP